MKCAYKGCPENGIHRVRLPGQVTQTLDVCLQHQILLEGMMAKICFVTACDATQTAKGLCSVHYQRFRYYKLVPEGGIKDAAQADAIAAEWRKLSEEARAKAAPPIPKAPKVESAYLTVSAGPALPPPPVAKAVHPVTAPARSTASKPTGQAATGPGSARLRKLQANLDEMTQARDRLAEDRKGLVQQVKDLTEKLSRVEGAQDQPGPVKAERDAMQGEIDRLTTEASAIAAITREYGHDLGRIYADLEAALTFGGTNVDPEYRDPKYADLVRRVLGKLNDLTEEVKRLSALDGQANAMDVAMERAGVPRVSDHSTTRARTLVERLASILSDLQEARDQRAALHESVDQLNRDLSAAKARLETEIGHGDAEHQERIRLHVALCVLADAVGYKLPDHPDMAVWTPKALADLCLHASRTGEAIITPAQETAPLAPDSVLVTMLNAPDIRSTMVDALVSAYRAKMECMAPAALAAILAGPVSQIR